MDRAFLEGLGLTVTESTGVVEAELALGAMAPAINPLTRQVIEAVSFTVVGDRLLYVGPPEFVGAQPINLAFITPATRLQDLVSQTLVDHLFQLERRSSELSALGVPPKVDPQTLQLTAELAREPFRFVIAANRTGQFRVSRAEREGTELSLVTPTPFELSEFRDRKALEDFLFAMFSDIANVPKAAGAGLSMWTSTETPPPQDHSVSFADIHRAFGDAQLPARSGLEIVAELDVGGQVVRFAAARVQGRTFRGLLAGPKGKLWAGRFELLEFKGIRQQVAQVMKVPLDKVKLLSR